MLVAFHVVCVLALASLFKTSRLAPGAIPLWLCSREPGDQAYFHNVLQAVEKKADGSLRLWHLASGRCMRSLQAREHGTPRSGRHRSQLAEVLAPAPSHVASLAHPRGLPRPATWKPIRRLS